MTRLRRSFTAEFKLEAASLVLDQGYSVPEASRSLQGEIVNILLKIKNSFLPTKQILIGL